MKKTSIVLKNFNSCMLFRSVLTGILSITFLWSVQAQVEERPRPEEWADLVEGGKFMDLFRPIPLIGGLEIDIWGAEGVVPRYVDNGIEDGKWSYWGGNIFKDEAGKYHMFVCRWLESSPKGHMEWPNSIVVHAVSDHSIGPFKVIGEVGKGHNPEVYRLEDGRYVVYVIDGYYLSDDLNGPWEYGKFDFDPRDRPIIEGLSNLSFAEREDGSYLMVCRGGGLWVSEDGLGSYEQVSDKRAYPDVDGRFEDPVIWKDHIQYHMIVNDWLGRIAFYLRSPDGIHWKADPGEAYQPGITVYEDGTNEDWFKYERIKILQDDLGRAVQANFAVIDTLKFQDKSNDHHSSKNIGIPLTVGRQLEILNHKKIDENTKKIEVVIKAEKGFDPHKDLDLASLHFGASEEVNFGRGSKISSTRKKGMDLVLVFDGQGNGLTGDNFVAKLLGKNLEGGIVFGYARLPEFIYEDAILSARRPEITQKGTLRINVKNFGIEKSVDLPILVEVKDKENWKHIAKGTVASLKSYQEKEVMLEAIMDFGDRHSVYRVTIGKQFPEYLVGGESK